MSKTARQVVVEAVTDWLERGDIGRFTDTQRLENITSIWEYGKWCAKGAMHRLGCKPQINFRGSRPVSTAWDGIADISDEEGMRIHSATIGLSAESLEIIRRSYERWENSGVSAKSMTMRLETFCRRRKEALEFIANNLVCHR